MTETETLEAYLTTHSDPEPTHLAALDRDTHLQLTRPHMCSGHLQGRVLKMLVRMIRPHAVLELGTYSGYSAQCLAEGLLEPGATVHTIEVDDELEDFLRAHFAASPVGSHIRLHIGPAEQVLLQLGSEVKFQLVFIDANKRSYLDYYRLVLPHVSPGGFIVADNTLWGGKLTDGTSHDAQTRGIQAFNDAVAADTRVEKVMLPLRDGLTIIWLKPANLQENA